MKKFYISALLTLILLPFSGKGLHIFGAEITTIVESYQPTANPEALIWKDTNVTVQVLDTVNDISHTDITDLIAATTDEPEKPKVQLFPNPTQGEFILDINDDTWLGATASIHNIIGQEMDQRKVTLGENSYNITDYQQGIYFLTLRQGELQNVLRFVKR